MKIDVPPDFLVAGAPVLDAADGDVGLTGGYQGRRPACDRTERDKP
jgi:hypothetical protein